MLFSKVLIQSSFRNPDFISLLPLYCTFILSGGRTRAHAGDKASGNLFPNRQFRGWQVHRLRHRPPAHRPRHNDPRLRQLLLRVLLREGRGGAGQPGEVLGEIYCMYSSVCNIQTYKLFGDYYFYYYYYRCPYGGDKHDIPEGVARFF